MAKFFNTIKSVNLQAVERELVNLATASEKSILIQDTLTVNSNGQSSFSLQQSPLGNKILLSLNGQLLTQGEDYTLSEAAITITNNNIETSDILIASYLA
jgi:hypothetical protein